MNYAGLGHVAQLEDTWGRQGQGRCWVQVQNLSHEAEQVMRHEHRDPSSDTRGAGKGMMLMGPAIFRVCPDSTEYWSNDRKPSAKLRLGKS